MNPNLPSELQLAAPPDRLLNTRGEWLAALQQALASAAAGGCRELWWSDADFAQWPLGESAFVEGLTQWAQPHRRLRLFAEHYDLMPRRHARWVEWRRRWTHVVECLVVDEAERGHVPTMLLVPGLVTVRLFDRERFRGRVSHSAAEAVAAREALDALSQRSTEGFAATTLGL